MITSVTCYTGDAQQMLPYREYLRNLVLSLNIVEVAATKMKQRVDTSCNGSFFISCRLPVVIHSCIMFVMYTTAACGRVAFRASTFRSVYIRPHHFFRHTIGVHCYADDTAVTYRVRQKSISHRFCCSFLRNRLEFRSEILST